MFKRNFDTNHPYRKPALRVLRVRSLVSLIFFALAFYSLGIISVMRSQCNLNHRDGSVAVREDGIHFDGNITFASMTQLLDELNKPRDSTLTVWLESGGGNVDSALYLALMISHRNVRMAVGNGSYCGSACVILFLSGDQRLRYAAPTAGFGLHGIYCPDTLEGLECRAEGSYDIGASKYKSFIQDRAEEWYSKALFDHAFENPPAKAVCYTFPDGADHAPRSERENEVSRANCQMAFDMLRAQWLTLGQSCSTSFWQRARILLLYYLTLAENTAVHMMPAAAPSPRT